LAHRREEHANAEDRSLVEFDFYLVHVTSHNIPHQPITARVPSHVSSVRTLGASVVEGVDAFSLRAGYSDVKLVIWGAPHWRVPNAQKPCCPFLGLDENWSSNDDFYVQAFQHLQTELPGDGLLNYKSDVQQTCLYVFFNLCFRYSLTAFSPGATVLITFPSYSEKAMSREECRPFLAPCVDGLRYQPLCSDPRWYQTLCPPDEVYCLTTTWETHDVVDVVNYARRHLQVSIS
jgi:hypothetical protein